MKWLKAKPQTRIENYPFERPLLHACSGEDWFLGDVKVDLIAPTADVRADVRQLPFRDNSFAAAFADPPWTAAWKSHVASMMKELLRVSEVVYTVSPWTYGSSGCYLDWVRVAWQPGVNPGLLFCRYEKRGHGLPRKDESLLLKSNTESVK